MSKSEIAALLRDGAAAGFVWLYGKVAYRPNPAVNHKVSLGDAPYVKVLDVAKFEENFPGVILAALGGTSVMVQCQGVTRRMLKAVKSGSPKPTDAELREAVLNALRGTKNRASVVVKHEKVFLYGDVEYTTREAALLAEWQDRIVQLVDAGLDTENAQAAAEAGMRKKYGDEQVDALQGLIEEDAEEAAAE